MKLICKYCSVKFESDRSNKKYCTKQCYTLSQKGKFLPRKQLQCPVCGIYFNKLLTSKAKYCSKDCWGKRAQKVLLKCGECENNFYKYVSSNAKFCSKRCSDLNKKKSMLGSNGPNWKNGATNKNQCERTRVRYREWRCSIFIRDKYTCQKCGNKSGMGKKIILNAHHIKEFAIYKELRYELSNGITLCKECHIKEHNHKF